MRRAVGRARLLKCSLTALAPHKISDDPRGALSGFFSVYTDRETLTDGAPFTLFSSLPTRKVREVHWVLSLFFSAHRQISTKYFPLTISSLLRTYKPPWHLNPFSILLCMSSSLRGYLLRANSRAHRTARLNHSRLAVVCAYLGAWYGCSIWASETA